MLSYHPSKSGNTIVIVVDAVVCNAGGNRHRGIIITSTSTTNLVHTVIVGIIVVIKIIRIVV